MRVLFISVVFSIKAFTLDHVPCAVYSPSNDLITCLSTLVSNLFGDITPPYEKKVYGKCKSDCPTFAQVTIALTLKADFIAKTYRTRPLF